MTTTASKHGLRAAAEKRTNRHAQRTPLPPRAGDVQDARDAIAETAKAAAEMTTAELRVESKRLGLKGYAKLSKGDLFLAVVAARNAQEPASVEEPESPTPAATSNAAEAELDPKGLGKARKLRDAVLEYGWSSEISALDARTVQSLLRRGDEAIRITWTEGVFDYETASYVIGDRVTKIRNVSQAKQMAGKPAEQAAVEFKRVSENRAWRRKPKEVKRDAIPFDVDTATDEEVLAALSGQIVRWRNKWSETDEQGRVGAPSKHLKITRVRDERVVNYLDPSGFRAFRLNSLISVGRK